MRSNVFSITTILVVLAGACTGVGTAAAQCDSPSKVRSNDCNEDDQAGTSVDISGDYMIMGSPNDNEGGNSAGAAHIFHVNQWGSWSQAAKLITKYHQPYDHGGTAVAIAGGDAIVGIPDTGALVQEHYGEVCIFGQFGDKWFEYARLQSDTPEYMAQFGSAVAAQPGTIMVGEPGGHDWYDAPGGTVYFFDDAGGGVWSQVAKHNQDGAAAGDDFGSAVAVYGKHAVAGAPGSSYPGMSNCGSVTTFFQQDPHDTWWRMYTVLAPDKSPNANFGASVAMGDGLMVVGAPSTQLPDASWAGAAYVYAVDQNGKLAFKQKLTDGGGYQFEMFGTSVAVAGKTIYVGTRKYGTVFRFTQGKDGQWAAVEGIVDPDQWWAGYFGCSMATDGERVVIGDDGDDYVELNMQDNGASYVVDVPSGCPADTNADGVLDLFDFLGFQNLFVAHDKKADLDCSKSYDFFDFLAYQNQFAAGCN